MILHVLTLISEGFFWFLPAGIANMVPVIAAKIPVLKHWDAPVDGKKTWLNRRILGDHKTWRGLCVGVLAAIITAYIQHHYFSKILPFPYLNPFLVGFLQGVGALGGDMVKSFFKRHMNIHSGKTWFPWDQLDYILGGFIAISLIIQPAPDLLIATAIIYFILHLTISFLGYKLKFKLTPI